MQAGVWFIPDGDTRGGESMQFESVHTMDRVHGKKTVMIIRRVASTLVLKGAPTPPPGGGVCLPAQALRRAKN